MVAGAGHALADGLVERLDARGRGVLRLTEAECVTARLAIRPGRLEAGGTEIGALAFLSSPSALVGGRAGEEGFAGTEARARWLAAINLPWVRVLNRYDADTWFRGPGWPVWRPRLAAAGIRVAQLRAGAAAPDDWPWLPWASARPRAPQGQPAAALMAAAATDPGPCSTHLLVRGRGIDGAAPPNLPRLARALSEHGIELAELTLDHEGRVLALDPCPAPSDPTVAGSAADLLVELLV